MIWLETLLAFTQSAVLLMLGIALCLAFFRLVRGPTIPDRVIALDLVAMIVVAMTIVDSMAMGEYHFLRAAIALALTSFLGTVAFAFYLQLKQGSHS